MGNDAPITIPYSALLEDDLTPLSDSITRAFGSSPDALGLILVSGLPAEFAKLREDALLAAARFAALPESVRERYTDPDSHFSFGWSHGKEVMNGRPDTHKGSYYANPLSDDSGATDAQREAHPSYLRSNVWPSGADCDGFEAAFKALARFMVDVGRKLARACDDLVAKHSNVPSVEGLIANSQCSKARLLHYYPPQGQRVVLDERKGPNGDESDGKSDPQGEEDEAADSWCGTHLDHSLLTALCPAIYLFHAKAGSALPPLPVPAPTATAGLFIATRAGKTVKAAIPADCMAFQTGEALQLLSRGQLKATPHWVSGGAGPGEAILPATLERIRKHRDATEEWKDVQEGTISRETMAVFLQPDVDAVIGEEGETFGGFTQRILSEHYGG